MRRARSGHAHVSRFPAWPSTRSASRISPTRSTCATTSCESSKPPTLRSTHGRARRRTSAFVFVGAGYAGVEALAELSDLVRDALRFYPRLRDAPQRWVLVDAAPKVLPEIPTRLGDYAARELEKRGVEIRVETTLASLSATEAVLSNGERIPTQTLVWTAGVRANPLLGELGLPLDERGRVRVDSYLRVEGRERVWALGDSAAVPNTRTPEHVDPPTSQHALRQARRLAKNLEGEPSEYGYRMLGQVATLGRYKGIADVMGLRFRGFPGWFLTRSLPPLPAAAPDPEAPRRHRLDDVALLPPRHRRALAPHPPAPPRRVTTGGVRSTTAAISSSVSSAPRDQASANTVSPSAARSACTVES